MHSIDIRQSEKFPEPGFSRLQRIVFEDLQRPSSDWTTVLREEAEAMAPSQQTHSPIFRVGAYERDELVGWSCGWMERGGMFYMANSGVVASHRRRGIYGSLLAAVREHATSEGAAVLRSQHSVLNNPVIIAKLRAGFNVSGLSQSAQMGTLVELTLHLFQGRQDAYRDRVLPHVDVDVV
jgi:GNAT superfamily N-acetyltransferase